MCTGSIPLFICITCHKTLKERFQFFKFSQGRSIAGDAAREGGETPAGPEAQGRRNRTFLREAQALVVGFFASLLPGEPLSAT